MLLLNNFLNVYAIDWFLSGYLNSSDKPVKLLSSEWKYSLKVGEFSNQE